MHHAAAGILLIDLCNADKDIQISLELLALNQKRLMYIWPSAHQPVRVDTNHYEWRAGSKQKQFPRLVGRSGIMVPQWTSMVVES